MINNFDKLNYIMKRDSGHSYYFFIALKRRKDDPNNVHMKESKIIQTWIITDHNNLEQYIDEMKKVIVDNKCRLYMCTDRKSYIKSMVTLRDDITKLLDQALCNQRIEFSAKNYAKLLTSNCMKDTSSDKKSRYWLFDIDSKDKALLDRVINLCNDYYKATFETINGYHVIAERKFNAHAELYALKYHTIGEIPVEVKENALVLVATGF